MMLLFAIQAIWGYLIDLLVGDPPSIPHPVVLMGKGIGFLEQRTGSMVESPTKLKLAGVGIAMLIPLASYFVTALLLWLAWQVHMYVMLILGAWLISTTIATKGLADAAASVKMALTGTNLANARQQVGMIVGRDTSCMDHEQIARATVETVAENTVDAVVAPLFYACIGGPPLAMAYRAINTLDSMLGYRHGKYQYLGWASAKLDDIASFLPARLTGLAMLGAAWLSNRHWRRAWHCWRRDAAGHPSPNGGVPESVMAGSIGVRLGGTNSYHGATYFRPYLGDAVEKLRPDHIQQAIHMLYTTTAIAAIVMPSFILLFWWLLQ